MHRLFLVGGSGVVYDLQERLVAANCTEGMMICPEHNELNIDKRY
jgi:hypothetical protein